MMEKERRNGSSGIKSVRVKVLSIGVEANLSRDREMGSESVSLAVSRGSGNQPGMMSFCLLV